MSRPRLLLLDEPSLGLAPVMVEQNARKTLEIAHHGFLLQKGKIVGRGTAAELAASEIVRHAYLRA